MIRYIPGTVLCLLLSTTAAADESPYKGQETRQIKALSASEITGYEEAHGMGFAKVAELNHYPGPRHVLDMADELGLSAGQIELTQRAFDVMHERASSLGKELVELETKLDAIFAGGEAVSEEVSALIQEIAVTRGKIRFAHVRAHIAMRSVLSAEQIQKYDALRGYGEE